MKKLYLLLTLFILSVHSIVQAQNFAWASQFGSTFDDIGDVVTTDKNGNVYIAGSFYNTVDFNPGFGTLNLTSFGSSDGFIVKLDSSGNFIWARQIGGVGDENV